MIRPVILGLVVAFSSVAWAQSSSIGAVVQTWHLNLGTNMVTLTIGNLSHKEITAYNISVKEIYADGSVNSHELLSDYVGRLVFIEDQRGSANEALIRKQFGDGLFHPGETHEELIQVRPGLRDCQAAVDVVTYADRTGEATNDDGLKRLVAHRKAEVASRQLAHEMIKAALANPNDTNPSATAAKQLQDQITIWRAQVPTNLDLEPGSLQSVVGELQGMTREALKQYLAKNQKRIAILSPHAQVTKTESQL